MMSSVEATDFAHKHPGTRRNSRRDGSGLDLMPQLNSDAEDDADDAERAMADTSHARKKTHDSRGDDEKKRKKSSKKKDKKKKDKKKKDKKKKSKDKDKTQSEGKSRSREKSSSKPDANEDVSTHAHDSADEEDSLEDLERNDIEDNSNFEQKDDSSIEDEGKSASSLSLSSKSFGLTKKGAQKDAIKSGAEDTLEMEDLATEVLEDIEFAPVLRGNVNAKHIVRKHVLQCGYLERLTGHGLSRELTGSSPWVKRYFGVRVLVSQAPSDGVLTARVELAYAKDEDEFIEGLIKSAIALEKGKTIIRLGLGRKSTMWIKTDSKCWTLRTKDIDWATYWALGLQGITGIEVETGSYMVWPYPRLRPAPSADIWLSVDPKMRSLRRLRESARSPLSQDEETFVVQGALHDAKDILFRKNFLNGNVLRLKHHLSLGSAWVRRFFSLDAVVGQGLDGVATVQVELTYSETELDHACNHVSRGLVLDRTVELELACTSGPILYLRKMGHKPWVLKFDKVRQAMYWTAGIQKVTGAPLESFKPVQWPYGSIKEPMSVDAWLESEEAAEVLSAEGRLVDVISSED